MTDIITKDRNKFLKAEKKHYGTEVWKNAKIIFKGQETSCKKCGVYYWKKHKKRCYCK